MPRAIRISHGKKKIRPYSRMVMGYEAACAPEYPAGHQSQRDYIRVPGKRLLIQTGKDKEPEKPPEKTAE